MIIRHKILTDMLPKSDLPGALHESFIAILAWNVCCGQSAAIPFAFLPLQDCVDISIFLIRTTATIQSWITGVRGVGGAIDVAMITRTEGFKAVQQKRIKGERPYMEPGA